MYGYPGSGKTSFARQFAHEHNFLHISADRIRYELFDDPQFTVGEEQVVIALMNYMVEQALKSKTNCIYDRGVGIKKQRDALISSASKSGFIPLTVWCQTDRDTAQYRALNRDRRKAEDRYSFTITQEVFDAETKRMTKPDEKEHFVVVSGKHSFRAQAQTVLNKLVRLGAVTTTASTTAAAPAVRTAMPARRLRPQDVGRGRPSK